MATFTIAPTILVVNYTLKPGITEPLALTVVDANNLPIPDPTTGWSVRAQIRPSPASAIVLFEWNTTGGAGIGTVTFAGSVVTLGLVPANSIAWAWSSGVHDVLLTDPTGRVACLAEGTVAINPLITH